MNSFDLTSDSGPTVSGERVRIEGLPFDVVTMAEATRRIVALARAKDRPRYVCTGNLDHLVRARRDRAFADAYEGSALNLADGMPVVWLSRVLGGRAKLPERVAGSDLFWELVRASAEQGLRLFFLGGLPGAADLAACAAVLRHPGAAIVDTYCPPPHLFHTEHEQARIRARIAAARPDILLVGFGAPKQEKWIAANCRALGVPVSIGVGGTFELAAKMRRRAPRWMQRIGLEWGYRLVQEPKRLFARYLVDDLPYFFAAALRAVLRGGPLLAAKGARAR